MYYFFTSVYSATLKARIKLVPLNGQSVEGTSMSPGMFCKASHFGTVSVFPIGTDFCTEGVIIEDSTVNLPNKLYAVSLPPEKSVDKPTKEMYSAYNNYKGKTVEYDPDKDVYTEPEQKGKTPRRSYLSLLKERIPFKITSGYHVDEDQFYVLVRNIEQQINTLLVGSSGCGKTTLAKLVCDTLNIPCKIYDMGAMLDPISGLLGVHRLVEGGSVFDYAKFTQDVQEPGVILLDELSRASPTANNILFPCLDGRRELPVEIAGGKDCREIKIHPQCSFIATANIGLEYTGTSTMDRALVSRFFTVEVKQISGKSEKQVLVDRAFIKTTEAELITNIAEAIRNKFIKQELSNSISTRETLLVASLVNDGWSVVDALKMVVLPLFEGTLAEGERNMVAQILTSR